MRRRAVKRPRNQPGRLVAREISDDFRPAQVVHSPAQLRDRKRHFVWCVLPAISQSQETAPRPDADARTPPYQWPGNFGMRTAIEHAVYGHGRNSLRDLRTTPGWRGPAGDPPAIVWRKSSADCRNRARPHRWHDERKHHWRAKWAISRPLTVRSMDEKGKPFPK